MIVANRTGRQDRSKALTALRRGLAAVPDTRREVEINIVALVRVPGVGVVRNAAPDV